MRTEPKRGIHMGTKTIITTGLILITIGVGSSLLFANTIKHFFWEARTTSVLKKVAELENLMNEQDVANWKEPDAQMRIAAFVKELKDDIPDAVGVKIFTPGAIAVWSDLKTLRVGDYEEKTLEEFEEIEEEGSIIEEAEYSAMQEIGKSNLLEIYTPVKDSRGKTTGLIEFYFDASDVISFIASMRNAIWITTGVVLAIILFFLRLSFHKQDELILEKSEELANIINNSPVGILTIFPEGTVGSANPQWISFCCAPTGQTIAGTNIFEDTFVKELQIEPLIRETLLGTPFEADAHFFRNGTDQYVHLRGTPILSEKDGKVKQILVTAEDITKRKKLELEASSYTKNLEARITSRTKDLEAKVAELEQFQRVTVDREIRMTELKQQVERMRIKLKECGATLNEEDLHEPK